MCGGRESGRITRCVRRCIRWCMRRRPCRRRRRRRRRLNFICRHKPSCIHTFVARELNEHFPAWRSDGSRNILTRQRSKQRATLRSSIIHLDKVVVCLKIECREGELDCTSTRADCPRALLVDVIVGWPVCHSARAATERLRTRT